MAMGTRIGFGVLALFLAAACGDASTSNTGRVDLPPRDDAKDPPAQTGDDTTVTPIADPQPNEDPATQAEADTDGDGIPDSKDCDPASAAIAGTKLINDTLAADTQAFSVAPGFPTADWSYANESYVQTRLMNASDATFYMGDQALGDVDVEVAASSTDVTDTISPRLRQMFVLVGATMNNGSLDAYGCGVEVVQGMSPEQRTSVVKLSGPTATVTTTAIDRTPRNILKEGEPFSIKATLKGGTLTCVVSQGADVVTTAKADNLTNVTGSMRFFTRQTKAAFKNVKACKLATPAMPTK